MTDETRRGRRVEDHSRDYIGRKLPLVSVRGTDFADMRLMFNASLGIHWHVPLERSDVPVTLRNDTSSAFVDEFASILHLSIRAIYGETTWTLTVFGRRLPKFESRKLYVVPLALSPKADLKFFCPYHPVCPSLKPSSTYILCFFNQSLENRVLHVTPATINTRWELYRTHTLESANVKVQNIVTCEITLHVAQIVNTEQMQHYIP